MPPNIIPPNIVPLVCVGAAISGGIAYPLLVYFSLPYVSPGVLVVFALGVLALRVLVARRQAIANLWTLPLIVAALGLALLAAISPATAVKAYPVLVSLAAASVFGASLLSPTPLIERLARFAEPNLPVEGVVYTRAVTWIWTVFLIANAMIAAAIGVWGSAEQWTLWNGLISYVLMGVLFGGERMVRRFFFRRA